MNSGVSPAEVVSQTASNLYYMLVTRSVRSKALDEKSASFVLRLEKYANRHADGILKPA